METSNGLADMEFSTFIDDYDFFVSDGKLDVAFDSRSDPPLLLTFSVLFAQLLGNADLSQTDSTHSSKPSGMHEFCWLVFVSLLLVLF